MRRTKYQLKCENLAKRLKPITERQKEYAIAHLHSFLFKIRNRVYCSECGSEARELVDGTGAWECPHCGTRHTDERIRRAVKGCAEERFYYGVDTTVGGEQVKRHWIVFKNAGKGRKPEHRFVEVSRDFVGENGAVAVQGLSVRPMSLYYDAWNYDSGFGTRNVRKGDTSWRRHDIDDYVTYPVRSVAEWLRKRGYKAVGAEFGSLTWKTMLATEPLAEWLVKRGHIGWLEETSLYRLKKYKRELELADKHGYPISDIGMWMDTVGWHRDRGRDTLNAKWSRFPDLKAEHDRVMCIVERERAMARMREEERERESSEMAAMEHAEEYAERFGMYAGLVLAGSGITVTAITDIPHLLEEGRVMHHCVGTYWNEEDSLILTATDDEGRKLATVEWSLSEGRVVQCRGKCNSTPERYEEIVGLVECGKGRIMAVGS